MHGTDRRPWGLIVAAVFALSACIALYTLGDIRTHLLRYYALITAVMAVMMLAYRAWDILAGDNDRRAVNIVIGAAIVFRVALLGLQPSLSDDLFRYAWDGHLVAHGINPYAYVPADPKLAGERNEAYPRIAYKDYHSLYPPLMEAGLGAAAWLSETVFDGSMRAMFVIWKLMLIGAELVSLLLLARLLAFWKMPARRLLLYAWHPLPIIEFAGQGHSDALMITGMLWCVWALARAKRGEGMLGYAFAIATRWVPLVFAPVLGRFMGWPRMILGVIIACALTLPFYSPAAWHGLADSTLHMGQSFVFNGFGFWILYGLCELFHTWSLEPYITAFLASVFVAGLFAIARRQGAITPAMIPQRMLIVCTLFVLVVWNMHPWYFTWGLALVPLAFSWGWLWVSFVSQFTYVHYTPRSDAALLIAGIVEYGGFIALLIAQRRFGVARNRPRG